MPQLFCSRRLVPEGEGLVLGGDDEGLLDPVMLRVRWVGLVSAWSICSRCSASSLRKPASSAKTLVGGLGFVGAGVACSIGSAPPVGLLRGQEQVLTQVHTPRSLTTSLGHSSFSDQATIPVTRASLVSNSVVLTARHIVPILLDVSAHMPHICVGGRAVATDE